MHSYLHLYIKRDDFLTRFNEQTKKSMYALTRAGLSPRAARKRVKHNAWKWVKKYFRA